MGVILSTLTIKRGIFRNDPQKLVFWEGEFDGRGGHDRGHVCDVLFCDPGGDHVNGFHGVFFTCIKIALGGILEQIL